jgi:5-methylcytosine-specific restriction endonuclease McrA
MLFDVTDIEKALKGYYSSHQKNAETRGFLCLSRKAWNSLVKNPCIYCGGFSVKKKYGIILNGVDRVNSQLGYTEKNSASCCSSCNKLKHTLSKDDFVLHIKEISKYQSFKIDNPLHGTTPLSDEISPAIVGRHYSLHKLGAKHLKVQPLELSEWAKFVYLTCHYCGSIDTRSHASSSHFYPKSFNAIKMNGIDRIDSSIGYSLENCVPCCARCNWMKSDLSQEEFLQRVKYIYTNFYTTTVPYEYPLLRRRKLWQT